MNSNGGDRCSFINQFQWNFVQNAKKIFFLTVFFPIFVHIWSFIKFYWLTIFFPKKNKNSSLQSVIHHYSCWWILINPFWNSTIYISGSLYSAFRIETWERDKYFPESMTLLIVDSWWWWQSISNIFMIPNFHNPEKLFMCKTIMAILWTLKTAKSTNFFLFPCFSFIFLMEKHPAYNTDHTPTHTHDSFLSSTFLFLLCPPFCIILTKEKKIFRLSIKKNSIISNRLRFNWFEFLKKRRRRRN